MEDLLCFYIGGIAMESRFRPAFPLIVLLISCILFISCSNPQQNFDKGRYEETIKQIDRKKNPTSDELLLKAKSYISINQDEKALESLFIYLSMDEDPTSENRAYAVEHFIALNKSDRLTVMVLLPTDGLDAQKALYVAYSRLGEKDKASEILSMLSRVLDFNEYVSLMLSAPHDIAYVIDIFTAWYGTITESDKDSYLNLLSRFSSEINIPENEAKRFLPLTDLLMSDSYYTDDDIRLSCLLKIKGNILDMLYDRVNARIYWTQAYKLNPDDIQLRDKLKR